MIAADELKRMLKERGVEYETNEDERDPTAEPERIAWEYNQCGYEMYVVATEVVDAKGKPYLDMDFHHYHTPEQAIAATLGGGECEAIHDKGYYKGIHGYCEGLKCSNCGEPLFSEFGFCPWCGAKVKAVKR